MRASEPDRIKRHNHAQQQPQEPDSSDDELETSHSNRGRPPIPLRTNPPRLSNIIRLLRPSALNPRSKPLTMVNAIPSHLTIVCCHAIYLIPSPYNPHVRDASPNLPSGANWSLASFQKPSPSIPWRCAENQTFMQHIDAGIRESGVLPVEIAMGDGARDLGPEPDGSHVLIFSGGRTKEKSGGIKSSEASSYLRAVQARGAIRLIKHPLLEAWKFRVEEVQRTKLLLLEEHATDSYQNLLFSILLFRRTWGRYPEKVTVVTHEFKMKRIMGHHVPALKWPHQRIRLIGIDPPLLGRDLLEAVEGEENAVKAWEADMYGMKDVLAGKREARGWDESVVDRLGDGLEDSVKELLRWKGGESGTVIFPGELPWQPAVQLD